MERPTELIETLHKNHDAAPRELSFWPTHYAGALPRIEAEDEHIFYANTHGRTDLRPSEGDRVIAYAKRMTTAANAIPTLLAYIEELEKALEPFAAFSDTRFTTPDYASSFDQTPVLRHHPTNTIVTVGDFKSASALLNQKEG